MSALCWPPILGIGAYPPVCEQCLELKRINRRSPSASSSSASAMLPPVDQLMVALTIAE
jgi:hypothetical protein